MSLSDGNMSAIRVDAADVLFCHKVSSTSISMSSCSFSVSSSRMTLLVAIIECGYECVLPNAGS